MFSDYDETSPSIAAVSAPSAACSMLAVQQQKTLSPVRRRVRGTTKLPHDETRSVDRPGILATDVRRSEIYSAVCPRRDLWTSKHSLYWILWATGNQWISRIAGVTRSRGLRRRIGALQTFKLKWSKINVTAWICPLIAKLLPCFRKSVSLNIMTMSEFWQEALGLAAYAHAQIQIWPKTAGLPWARNFTSTRYWLNEHVYSSIKWQKQHRQTRPTGYIQT